VNTRVQHLGKAGRGRAVQAVVSAADLEPDFTTSTRDVGSSWQGCRGSQQHKRRRRGSYQGCNSTNSPKVFFFGGWSLTDWVFHVLPFISAYLKDGINGLHLFCSSRPPRRGGQQQFWPLVPKNRAEVSRSYEETLLSAPDCCEIASATDVVALGTRRAVVAGRGGPRSANTQHKASGLSSVTTAAATLWLRLRT